MTNEWAWAGLACVLMLSGVYLLTLRSLRRKISMAVKPEASR